MVQSPCCSHLRRPVSILHLHCTLPHPISTPYALRKRRGGPLRPAPPYALRRRRGGPLRPAPPYALQRRRGGPLRPAPPHALRRGRGGPLRPAPPLRSGCHPMSARVCSRTCQAARPILRHDKLSSPPKFDFQMWSRLSVDGGSLTATLSPCVALTDGFSRSSLPVADTAGRQLSKTIYKHLIVHQPSSCIVRSLYAQVSDKLRRHIVPSTTGH